MSKVFRELLRKVGSGQHTSKNLSRQEAEAATLMMLQQEATPAQIGAFMIAHRIKRPTGEELAGMVDAYDKLGPHLPAIDSAIPVAVLGSPYDGRSRTAPINPLTGLILATAGVPVVMHGGDRMPTKDGLPLIELWQALDLEWQELSLVDVHRVLNQTLFGFVYLPQHFPLAHNLVTYREQIGKRPPFATVELMWSPYHHNPHIVCGFVHPPTEEMIRQAFALRGQQLFTTVKGSEGSCDLPRDRTAIIGLGTERMLLTARDYGFLSQEFPLPPIELLAEEIKQVISGEGESELKQSAIWNSGFYLWRFGIAEDIKAGFAYAERLLTEGKVYEKVQSIRTALDVKPARV